MQPPPSRKKFDDHEARLRRLLALELHRIITDLELREQMLIELWGRHRDRGPMLDTIFSRWSTLSFPDLAELPTDQIILIDAFMRELDVLRMYFRFSEDMPTTMADELSRATRRLRVLADLTLPALGGLPEMPVIDFGDDAEPHERPKDSDDAAPDGPNDDAPDDPDPVEAPAASPGPNEH